MSNFDQTSFSKRHGHLSNGAEITIWNDAPQGFRYAMLSAAASVNVRPSTLRSIACRVLRTPPERSNWSEYPNIWEEVQDLVYGCEWYRVYDILEAIAIHLIDRDRSSITTFEAEINDCFQEMGIGWQIKQGTVQSRTNDVQEKLLAEALGTLESSKLQTAQSELVEAVKDLSRRPTADVSGAVQHSMAALECVAREVSGDSKSTLGAIISKNPDLFPKPLDGAIEKIWG